SMDIRPERLPGLRQLALTGGHPGSDDKNLNGDAINPASQAPWSPDGSATIPFS
ncbi:MAG: hypothetical protein H6Q06_1309, partial [Acidobacteria bacterium]|nr:hypothetical protein [Acidobacteriota bacterium]